MKEDIDVTSPTYTIIQTYQPHKGPEIWHMDFYRLNNSVDINDLDLDGKKICAFCADKF